VNSRLAASRDSPDGHVRGTARDSADDAGLYGDDVAARADANGQRDGAGSITGS